MTYLLDSDATPDKCPDPIWILGVQHPGWEELPTPVPPFYPNPHSSAQGHGLYPQTPRRSSGSPPSFRSSTSSITSAVDHPLSQSLNFAPTSSSSSSASGYPHPPPPSSYPYSYPNPPPSTSKHKEKDREKDKDKDKDPSAHWPPVFYHDFTSKIWLTYRSQFAVPIRDGRLGDLDDGWESSKSSNASSGGGKNGGKSGKGGVGGLSSPTSTVKKSPWHWVGGEKTWSSDSGWGCMLRTGQSLLANTLVFVMLGRDWRRPPYPLPTAEYATYVQILTWFLDTPSPEAPFSVHRMALAGKDLGTDVGQWFGPSVAAGAIRQLVSDFADSPIGVSVASDGVLYTPHVFAASNGDMSKHPRKANRERWGDKPVLVLIGLRLGIEGVNKLYYDTIKLMYRFPQSVGIAGGRPSSSYYFVGSQADNLFYLDPHHARPAIPVRSVPKEALEEVARRREAEMREEARREQLLREREREERELEKQRKKEGGGMKGERLRERQRRERETTPDDSDREVLPPQTPAKKKRTGSGSSVVQPQPQYAHSRTPTSPSSPRAGSYHAPASPSPLQQQFSSSSADSGVASYESYPDADVDDSEYPRRQSIQRSPSNSSSLGPPSMSQTQSPVRNNPSGSSAAMAALQQRSPPPSYPGGTVRHGRWRSHSASASQPTSPAMSPSISASNSISSTMSSGSEMDYRELSMSYAPSSYHPHAQGQVQRPASSVGGRPASAGSGYTQHSQPPMPPMQPLDPVQAHYCAAYSPAELKTFHCERVRKMPLSGLDPSMLLGFLVRDADDWQDLRNRLHKLHKPVFAISDVEPDYPSDSEDNMGLESFDEPDDIDMSDDEEGLKVPDSDDDDDAERARVKNHDEEDEFEGEDDDEDLEEISAEGEEGDNEPFFDTRSTSNNSASSASNADRSEQGKSEDVDTEDDPVGPMTPGPGTRFEMVPPVAVASGKGKMKDGEDDEGDSDGDRFEDDDIEDDWIDPSLPTPSGPPQASVLTPQPSIHQKQMQQQQPPPVPAKDPSPSPPSSSNVPPLAKSKPPSGSSAKHERESTGGSTKSKTKSKSSKSTTSSSSQGSSASKRTHKQVPVPVPTVRVPVPNKSAPAPTQYPFPVTLAEDGSVSPQSRSRHSSATRAHTGGGGAGAGDNANVSSGNPGGKRMHTARARDGGRTQSGGVKGILTDD